MPETATACTRAMASPMRFSRDAESPASVASFSTAPATSFKGSAPVGMRSCGVTQSPARDASWAMRRTSVDFPSPGSPRIVLPRSGRPARRRGRTTSRQSLNCAVRPAHTSGMVSEPGLKGLSSASRMLITLSTCRSLDKVISPTGRSDHECQYRKHDRHDRRDGAHAEVAPAQLSCSSAMTVPDSSVTVKPPCVPSRTRLIVVPSCGKVEHALPEKSKAASPSP